VGGRRDASNSKNRADSDRWELVRPRARFLADPHPLPPPHKEEGESKAGLRSKRGNVR
jgi:hypothetical protein